MKGTFALSTSDIFYEGILHILTKKISRINKRHKERRIWGILVKCDFERKSKKSNEIFIIIDKSVDKYSYLGKI